MTFSQQLAFTNESNRFMRHCGISIVYLEKDCCRAALKVEDYCKNTGTTVHGGLIYTMADCVVSAYARAVGVSPVTLSGNLQYLSNVTGGTLTAQATPVQMGGRIMVFDVEISGEGRLLARGTFTCYDKRRPDQLQDFHTSGS